MSKDFNTYPKYPDIKFVKVDIFNSKKGVSWYELHQSIIGYANFNTLIDTIYDCRDITRKEIAMQEKEKRRQRYLELKKEFEGEEL